MSSFFEKLMLSRQVTFKEGKIEMLGGQRMVLFPQEFVVLFTGDISRNKGAVKVLYRQCRKDMKEGFIKNVMGSHSPTSRRDLLMLLTNIAGFAGWGVYKYQLFDESNHRVLIEMTDCLASSLLKNKVDSPCDHIFRGFIAGGATVALGKEVDCIESTCIALGDEKCYFIADTKENLKKEFPNLFELQIGEYTDG